MAQPSRRELFQAAGAATVVGMTIAACGDGDAAVVSSAPPTPAELGSASSIPVGGGKIFTEARVVVTQPVAGEFKGFSTRCTHKGCAVTKIQNGFIECPCHHSRFAVATGAPTPDSPAHEPLASVPITVSGGQVSVT